MQTLAHNPNLKRLADLLGWARKMVRGEWRKSPHGKTEMTGYSVQPLQPEHMAGFEYAALLSGDDTLHLDWLRRALDGGVRHRRYAGQEKQGRGPLVLVRDESGSMEGDPHATAVALELALLEICRRDKRDFYSIPFSGSGHFHVWQAPRPGLPDPQGLLDHLAHFYNGGTEPYLPLTKALELIAGGNLADRSNAATRERQEKAKRRRAVVREAMEQIAVAHKDGLIRDDDFWRLFIRALTQWASTDAMRDVAQRRGLEGKRGFVWLLVDHASRLEGAELECLALEIVVARDAAGGVWSNGYSVTFRAVAKAYGVDLKKLEAVGAAGAKSSGKKKRSAAGVAARAAPTRSTRPSRPSWRAPLRRWCFHDGTEIVDAPTLRFFLLAMTRTAEGRWLAVCQGERNWFEAEDTPFVVQRLGLTVRAGALDAVELRLAGDYRERLDPGTLEADGGRLHCRVRRGAFPARLGRVAVQQLAPFLAEDTAGVALVMREGRHPVRALAPVTP